MFRCLGGLGVHVFTCLVFRSLGLWVFGSLGLQVFRSSGL